MRSHEVTERRNLVAPDSGPRILICSCGLAVSAEYQLSTSAYDYNHMHAVMEAHLAEVGK